MFSASARQVLIPIRAFAVSKFEWGQKYSPLFLAAAITVSLLSGTLLTYTMYQRHLSAYRSSVPRQIASSRTVAVQLDPVYQVAAHDYACRKYLDALTLLGTLSKTPSYQRDAGAQRYLFLQKQICRRALGLKDIPQPVNARSALFQPAPRSADCGPRALLLLCRNNGIPVQLSTLKRQAGTTVTGTTLLGLAAAARQNGWKAAGVQMDAQALSQLSRPAIAWVDGDHYVAVLNVHDGLATIHDPNISHAEAVPTGQLWSRCGGILLTLQHS